MTNTYVVLSSREIIRGKLESDIDQFSFIALNAPEVFFRTLPNGVSIIKFMESIHNELSQARNRYDIIWRKPSTRMIIPATSILYMQSDIEYASASE